MRSSQNPNNSKANQNTKSVSSAHSQKRRPQIVGLDIQKSLQQDKIELNQINELIKLERSALEQQDHDNLKTLSEQKIKLSEKIEKRHQERTQYLQLHGYQANSSNSWREVIKQLSQLSHVPLLQLWDEVHKQLLDCQKLMSVNEKIIVGMQNNVHQYLDLLRGETSATKTYSAKTYSANGRSISQSNGQRIVSI